MNAKIFTVTIVGGGPVGLFLGICLTKLGIQCTIIEKRTSPVTDSRSLGIHPISMTLFQKLGMSEKILQAGIKIQKGLAYIDRNKIGEIDFSDLEEPFNFVVACPQFQTERILTEEFKRLNPTGLVLGAEVSSIIQTENKVKCTYKKNGAIQLTEANFLIGCDGKNSLVRQESGIFYGGKRYPDTYTMGDFVDNTNFSSDAAVFLTKDGLIESFPLPNDMRRWVIKTDSFIKEPSKDILSNLIEKRIGHTLHNTKHSMLSSFGVQHFMAESFYKGRVVLAGDSAHVVSPIGGQGMNLGWIGAWRLSEALDKIRQNPQDQKTHLSTYSIDQTRTVKKAGLRAELNMRLGRKKRMPFLKKILIHLLLKTPLSKYAARQFAMKNLVKV
jgi:2-polyprenyl-6-methoxyphenol hydroxylase-like FAD-dependent oxidoreductase